MMMRPLAILLALTAISSSNAASVDYKVRNAPGASTADTYLAIRNEIGKAVLQKRVKYSGNTSIARQWTDATFLKLGHERTAMEIQARPIDVGGMVEIICTECYITGAAMVELHIDVVDPVAHAQEVISNFTDEVQNITQGFFEYTVDYIGDYFGDVNPLKIAENLIDDGPQWKDLELPTFNYTMDLDIPEIPECKLKFQFDDLELYMSMNTILEASATYELPLYRSQSPVGLSITPDLSLGVQFTVDLILNVEGEIDISSGFHIKVDDGIALEITLFSDDVSEITFPGAQFEFLPVAIESAGMVFSAVLRLGVHAGFDIATPDVSSLGLAGTTVNKFIPDVTGGIEVGIFANVAEFITNITYTPEDEDCKRNFVQSYQLAVGAKAGATVAIGNDTWGPMPETSVPVWYTEMASLCAGEKAPTPATASSGVITTAPEYRRRQDLVTKTITSEFIHTGINCLSIGLINCPASLQNTSQSTETRTIVTALPPGIDATFPVTVMDTVPSPIAFKRGAASIPATSGSPVSYIPPAPTETSKLDAKESHENNKPLIIGLASGLGGGAVLAIIAGLMFCQRRRAARRNISNRGAYSAPDYAPKMAETPTTPAMSVGYMDYKVVKGAHVEEADLGNRSPSLRSP